LIARGAVFCRFRIVRLKAGDLTPERRLLMSLHCG
jgi:hypothetical protein